MSSPSLDYSVGGAVGLTITVLAVAILALGLRFWSRLISPDVSVGLDDWLAFCAMPFTIIASGLVLRAAEIGLGSHITDLSSESITTLLTFLSVGDTMFNFSISFSKISALVFYDKIFRVKTYPSKAWRWSYWTVLSLATVWPVAFFIIGLLRCPSAQNQSQGFVENSCAASNLGFVSNAMSSMLIDIAVLIIPIPPIWRLHLKMSQKIAIAGTFILGYSVACMSIGRLVTAARIQDIFETDPSFGFVPLLYWCVAEPGLSTFVICLPAILQLLKRLHSFGPGSLLNAKAYTRISSPGAEERNAGRKSPSQKTLVGANDNDLRSSERWQNVDVHLEPLQSIHVRKDSEVDIIIIDRLPPFADP